MIKTVSITLTLFGVVFASFEVGYKVCQRAVVADAEQAAAVIVDEPRKVTDHPAIRFVEMPFANTPRLWLNIHSQFSDGPLYGSPMVLRCELDRRVSGDQVERLALPRIEVEGGHYDQPQFASYQGGDVTVKYRFVPDASEVAKPKPPQGKAPEPWHRRRLLGDDEIGNIGSSG